MAIIIFLPVDLTYLSINVKITCLYVGSLLLVTKMRCLNSHLLIEMLLRASEELSKVIILVILFFFKIDPRICDALPLSCKELEPLSRGARKFLVLCLTNTLSIAKISNV